MPCAKRLRRLTQLARSTVHPPHPHQTQVFFEMDDYLTPKELVARYRATITVRTLANWRSSGEGPAYTKIGGRVLYPVLAVTSWETGRTLGVKA